MRELQHYRINNHKQRLAERDTTPGGEESNFAVTTTSAVTKTSHPFFKADLNRLALLAAKHKHREN